MNNEDKIMKTLDIILEGQKSTEKRLDNIEKLQEETRNELKDTKDEIQDTKKELQDTKNILLRMEQKHGKKLDTLFDAFEVNADKNKDLEKRVTVLENKSDSMDLHLKSVMHKQKASNQ